MQSHMQTQGNAMNHLRDFTSSAVIRRATGLAFLAATATVLVHAASSEPPSGPPAGQEEDQPRDTQRGHRRPPPPLIMALDIDRDGELSADEITLATESLLTLDADGNGRLTRDELHPHGPPPPPPMGRGGMEFGGNGQGRRQFGSRPVDSGGDNTDARGSRPRFRPAPDFPERAPMER